MILAYLRDGWNIVDFCIVFTSLLPILMGNSNSVNLASLRSLRVLRPLRTINSIKTLKVSMYIYIILIDFACHFVFRYTLFG